MYYNKVYCDDLGKKAPDIFSKALPEFLSYRKLWSGVIDGFMQCQNSDLMFLCTEGNIRLVIATENPDSTTSFNQYFMGDLDGKTVMIPMNTKFAIHNIDEGKSSYLMGHFEEELQYKYFSKTGFDWKKKLA